MKKYCENCELYNRWNDRSCWYIKSYKDTPLKKESIFAKCEVENKNNDCKYYKKVEIGLGKDAFRNISDGKTVDTSLHNERIFDTFKKKAPITISTFNKKPKLITWLKKIFKK